MHKSKPGILSVLSGLPLVGIGLGKIRGYVELSETIVAQFHLLYLSG